MASSRSVKRFRWERKKYNAVTHHRLSAEPTADDPLIWECTIRGKKESPFDGGVFVLHLIFPADYPFLPPAVKWITKIYHPTFKLGQTKYCIDILSDQWSPALSLWNVLSTLSHLLDLEKDYIPSMCCGKAITATTAATDGCRSSGLQEAVTLYFEDKPKFVSMAKQWTLRYANPNLLIFGYLRSGKGIYAIMPVENFAQIVSQFFGETMITFEE